MSDITNKINITPDTKVSSLLKTYPELKDILFDISPAFKKLSNPILLKTVAKVTTLKQAAQVGNISLPEMINRLRAEAGLNKIDIVEDQPGFSNQKPEWFNPGNIVQTLDARPMIDKGEHPIGEVLMSLKKLTSGKIYELITSFVPAPLIDKVDQAHYAIYTNEDNDKTIGTYFYKR